MSGAVALERWGFTGQRLLKLAARAARDHQVIPAGYLDDAVSYLAEVGMRAALEFDPERAVGLTEGPLSKRFEAFAYYRMRLRLIDWLRTTSNGHSFGRNGTQYRELLGTPERAETQLHRPKAPGASGRDPVLELDAMVDEVVLRVERERWKACANQSGVTLTEWAFQAMTIQADYQLA